MKTVVVGIAGMGLRLHFQGDPVVLLPDSFYPFISYKEEGRMLDVAIVECLPRFLTNMLMTVPVVESTDNILGKISLRRNDDGWMFSVSERFVMVCVRDFSNSVIYYLYGEYNPYAVSTLVHILFSQALVYYEKGFSCHASSVELGGIGYMFLGTSGYGKSTQSSLWCDTLGAVLINDDTPAVVVGEGETVVFGTPWSGKTKCYRNISHRLSAIFRLVRAGYNEAVELSGVDAFIALFPSCSCVRTEECMQGRLHQLVMKVLSSCRIVRLKCNRDCDAAVTAYGHLLMSGDTPR